MTSVVLTVLADDNPGLVDTLSSVIKTHKGNWEESRMAELAGKFAGIVLVTVPEEETEQLLQALRALESRGIQHVNVEIADAQTVSAAQSRAQATRELTLNLTGQDRPGIVADVTHVLAAHGINIEEFESETRPASMGGGMLFHASASLSVPVSVTDEVLRLALEGLANELMVDLDLA